MGSTSSDTRREIVALRGEIDAILGELERRGRAVADAPGQVAHHPITQSALALGLSVTVAAISYGLASRIQTARWERAEQQVRVGRWAEARWMDALQDRWQRAARLAAESESPIGAHVELRPRDARRETRDTEESRMVKRILWAATTAMVMAVATMVARRISAMLWERAMHEKPPGQPSDARV